MASFDDIRRGLAANIATVLLPDWQVSAYPLDNPTPPSVGVMGISEVEYETFAAGNAPLFTWVIEAFTRRAVDIAATSKLDELMDGGPLDLKAAIEFDQTLTKRLLEDGTVETNQAPACDSVWCEFGTLTPRITLPNNVEVLLATWNVQVQK